MSLWPRLALWIYKTLLAFYPPKFLAEYGEEMLRVFTSALLENNDHNQHQNWRVIWRELRDWPMAITIQHLNERRNSMSLNEDLYQEEPMTWADWLAGSLVFILPIVFPVMGLIINNGIMFPDLVNIIIQYVLLGSLGLALIYGLIKGLPRWSLPYLGFVVLICMFWVLRVDRIFGWIYPLFLETFGPRGVWPIAVSVAYNGIYILIFTFIIPLIALVLIALFRLLPFTRGLWRRLRADWTQLSYLLYGTHIFIILLSFDEYRYDEGWNFFAWIALAVFAVLHLRARTHKGRVWTLLSGSTVVMLSIMLAKYLLVPLQQWPGGYPISPSVSSHWVETTGAFFQWVAMLLILLSPALLDFLPGRLDEGPFPAEDLVSA